MRGKAVHKYCCDATALIDIAQHFEDGVKKLDKAAKGGSLVVPIAVFKEIQKKSDHLKTAVERWSTTKYQAVIRIDSTGEFKREYARIERTYGPDFMVGSKLQGGFWKSKAGQTAADAQVVAIAKVLKLIAVSKDQAVNNACLLENIECIGWQQLWRRITGLGGLFEE